MNPSRSPVKFRTRLKSSATGRVKGIISGPKGGPQPAAQVVLVPQVRTQTALYRTATTDQARSFAFRGIPPGNYSLFAWDYLEAGAYFNPEVLRRYEKIAAPLKIEGNSDSEVKMQVIPHEK
jgi:hypothetical protein